MNFAIGLLSIAAGQRHWKDRILQACEAAGDLLLPWEGKRQQEEARKGEKKELLETLANGRFEGRDFSFFPFVRVLPELPIGNLLGTILAGGNGKPLAFRLRPLRTLLSQRASLFVVQYRGDIQI